MYTPFTLLQQYRRSLPLATQIATLEQSGPVASGSLCTIHITATGLVSVRLATPTEAQI